MNRHSPHKVFWSEGLLVSPHHFQQMERNHEYLLGERTHFLAPYTWGAIELKVDAERLEKRKVFAVEYFRGVLPLGTLVDLPSVDAAPLSREIDPSYFRQAGDRLDVYLALPVLRPDGRNYGTSMSKSQKDVTQPGCRYATELITVVDECTGEDEQTIVVAKKNFQILFGTELTEAFDGIKVAEVVKHTDGSLALNEDYVPPCMVISASAYLQNLVGNVVHHLRTRSGGLSMAWHQRMLERHEGHISNPETLWLLGTLEGAISVLKHFEQVRHIHPEVVFRSLLQLAGQLHVLSVRLHVTDLPAYDHENLGGCFEQLSRTITTLLQGAHTPPGRLTGIHLKARESAAGDILLYTESPLDERLLTPEYRLHLIVEVARPHPHKEALLNETVPRNLTVAAFEQIDSYIDYAYGLRLIPSTLLGKEPSRPDIGYFQLENRGELWEAIQSLRTLAIYIPRNFRQQFSQFKVNLVAVREQAAWESQAGSELLPAQIAALGLS